MEAKREKRFFANHSKSSTMVVSLVLHAVLLVIALSFVAVTVVTKSEKKFERRMAKGEPEQVILNDSHLMRVYFPNKYAALLPPQPPRYYYTGEDCAEALRLIRKDNAPNLPAKSGITNNKFSLNVIFFAPKDDPDPRKNFKMLTRKCHGDFRIIKGLDAIKMSVSD